MGSEIMLDAHLAHLKKSIKHPLKDAMADKVTIKGDTSKIPKDKLLGAVNGHVGRKILETLGIKSEDKNISNKLARHVGDILHKVSENSTQTQHENYKQRKEKEHE